MSDYVELKFLTFDVFTDSRYAGNPLAVVGVPSSVTLTQEQKQIIAREFNYSETVILHIPDRTSDGVYPDITIDIFIVSAELPFAGHPTIGSIYMLSTSPGFAQYTNRDTGKGRLITKSGPVDYYFNKEEDCAYATISHDVHIHKESLKLGMLPQDILSPEIFASIAQESPVVSIVKGMTFILVELPNSQLLSMVTSRSEICKPSNLELDAPYYVNGGLLGTLFYVVRERTSELTCISCRMCVDGMEDPATGSAACTLTSYLTLKSSVGSGLITQRYELQQGYEMDRPSLIKTEITIENNTISKVVLGGSARQVMKGSLRI